MFGLSQPLGLAFEETISSKENRRSLAWVRREDCPREEKSLMEEIVPASRRDPT
jgi:hypothetical protein